MEKQIECYIKDSKVEWNCCSHAIRSTIPSNDNIMVEKCIFCKRVYEVSREDVVGIKVCYVGQEPTKDKQWMDKKELESKNAFVRKQEVEKKERKNWINEVESRYPHWAYFCYILECKDGSYYVGKCKYLHYRIEEHIGKKGDFRKSKYVEKHGFNRLVYFKFFLTEQQAYKREQHIKHWNDSGRIIRKYKEYLVNKFPVWKIKLFHRSETNENLAGLIMREIFTGEDDFIPKSPEEWLKENKI